MDNESKKILVSVLVCLILFQAAVTAVIRYNYKLQSKMNGYFIEECVKTGLAEEQTKDGWFTKIKHGVLNVDFKQKAILHRELEENLLLRIQELKEENRKLYIKVDRYLHEENRRSLHLVDERSKNAKIMISNNCLIIDKWIQEIVFTSCKPGRIMTILDMYDKIDKRYIPEEGQELFIEIITIRCSELQKITNEPWGWVIKRLEKMEINK